MPKSQKRYPWGSEKPSNRLRAVGARLDHRILAAREANYPEIQDRINAVVAETYHLVNALDHLSRNGLRSRGTDPTPLDHTEVDAVLDSVRKAISELGTSSAHTLSTRYETFLAHVTPLRTTAENAMKKGITASGVKSSESLWDPFNAG